MTSLVRKHSVDAGAITGLAATSVREDLVVTAVRTGEGKLKLIGWQVQGDQLIRRGDVTGGEVGTVSICAAGYERVATVCRNSSGDMSLVLWDVAADGDVSFSDAATAGNIGQAAPVGLGNSALATPVTDADGNLKVIAWAVSDDGKLTRCGDAGGGAASHLASDRWSTKRFVTAFRNSKGNLELIHWVVRPDGSVDRLGEAAAGAVTDVAIIRNHEGAAVDHHIFLTAVRDAGGLLKLIAWKAPAEGPVERLSDAVAGPARGVSVSHVGAGRYAAAYRDPEGDLRIQCFRWGATGTPSSVVYDFTLAEVASAGEIHSVAVAEGPSTNCVTAVRTAAGNLKMILWELEFD